MVKNEIINRLIEADKMVFQSYGKNYHANITIVGSSVLILNKLLPRQTLDIDIISLNRDLIDIFAKFDINSSANAFGDSLAENFEERLVKVNIPTKCLDYYILSLEDIVIMKLHSHRKKDYLDITSNDVLKEIDWKKLCKIVYSGETNNTFNERVISEFNDRFEKYIKDYMK